MGAIAALKIVIKTFVRILTFLIECVRLPAYAHVHVQK